ncbi:MAG: segregation/condensation protein A [Elusimicrobia bacterium]|nr:segregation/condensation protein A [Elusimicrobiota bacterium]
MSYDVKLEIFEGPLDLLLYLIKKNDLEIADIPIAQITQDYLRYLDLIKELNLEVAGEFLVMAATLMEVKAQMLMPRPTPVAEEGPDPRSELVAKLLEYQRFKEAAQVLAQRAEEAKDIGYRAHPPEFGDSDYALEVSFFELLDAFRAVLERIPEEIQEIMVEEIPIEAKIREILGALEGQPFLTLQALFAKETRRLGVLMTFLALLELIRLRQVIVRQSRLFGEIRLYPLPARVAGGELATWGA